MKLKVMVVGGSEFDAQLGFTFIEARNLCGGAMPLSTDPLEGNRLQFFSQAQLHDKIRAIIAKSEDFDILLVFCVSLTFAVNFKEITTKPVISPLDVLHSLAPDIDRVMLLAANAQCLHGIEKIIYSYNHAASILGATDLPLVKQIEQGAPEKDILERMRPYLTMAEDRNCRQILLGCTHLSPFHQQLQQMTSLEIIDVGQQLLKMLDEQC